MLSLTRSLSMAGYCWLEQYRCTGFRTRYLRSYWRLDLCYTCRYILLRSTERLVLPNANHLRDKKSQCSTSLPGSFFTSARVIYVAAKEGYLPSIFGNLHRTRGTPLNATLLQAGITMLFIVFGGGFRSLINFAVVASWA